ncbi:hypothetical protein Tco_0921175 [Tanacetum coccineum]
MHIAMNSVDFLDVKKSYVNECCKCLKLETELLKKKDFIEKEINEFKAQSQEKNTVITKLKEMIKSLMEKEGVENVKKDIDEIETINIELDHTMKNELRKLKGKDVVDNAVSKPIAITIAPGMFKINLEPLPLKLLNNREAHMDYLKHTREQTAIS